jgi:hypothetical protein
VLIDMVTLADDAEAFHLEPGDDQFLDRRLGRVVIVKYGDDGVVVLHGNLSCGHMTCAALDRIIGAAAASGQVRKLPRVPACTDAWVVSGGLPDAGWCLYTDVIPRRAPTDNHDRISA